MGKLDGTTAIVTGANTGIGRITALELASRGAHVFLACRSETKTQPVIDEIRAAGGQGDFLSLDLADLAQVRASAASFLQRDLALDILVNNAGLAGAHGTTRDGFELTFGTNHLGPYLFTRLLWPAVEKARTSRVVNVASTGHYRARGIDWDAVRKPTRTSTAFPEYCVSKLANVLFSKELARRAPSRVHTYALHPGAVASDVWREVPWGVRHLLKAFMLSNEDGARTSLHCASADESRDQTGLYYDRCRPKEPSRLALDPELSRELWDRSAEWVGIPSSLQPS